MSNFCINPFISQTCRPSVVYILAVGHVTDALRKLCMNKLGNLSLTSYVRLWMVALFIDRGIYFFKFVHSHQNFRNDFFSAFIFHLSQILARIIKCIFFLFALSSIHQSQSQKNVLRKEIFMDYTVIWKWQVPRTIGHKLQLCNCSTQLLKHLLRQFVNTIQSNLFTECIQEQFLFLKDCTSKHMGPIVSYRGF